MKGLFLDATMELEDVFARVRRPDDPPVDVHRRDHIEPSELPALLRGYGYLLDDRTFLPTEAMVAALRGGRIGHAALDVFDVEPLPPDHVLTTLPNVTLSAHSAFRPPEASGNLLRRALDIARSIAQG
jgi:hypothetical protein